jgi:hypothetical protein
MAEAMAVAGLFASVISFLDFGVKVAKLTKQVYEAQGELPKDLQKCQSTVDDFSDWIRNLQPSIGSTSTRADAALKTAIDHCIDDCDALLKILQRLLPAGALPGSNQDRTARFKTVLRALRSDGKIKKAQSSLESHKNELRLRIAERTMYMVEENR